MLTNPKTCPVCGEQHNQLVRMGSFDVIACKSVTPTGNTMFFPKKNVVVVGAGLYVDESPPQELTPEQLQARIDSLKSARASAAPPAPSGGKSVDDLKAELAELEKAEAP